MFKAVSKIHLLVNMSNLSSQSKRTEPLQDDGVDKELLLHNFVEAKQKANAKFRDLKKYLEDCEKFLAEFRKADENERDIKKFSSKVIPKRLSLLKLFGFKLILLLYIRLMRDLIGQEHSITIHEQRKLT